MKSIEPLRHAESNANGGDRQSPPRRAGSTIASRASSWVSGETRRRSRNRSGIEALISSSCAQVLLRRLMTILTSGVPNGGVDCARPATARQLADLKSQAESWKRVGAQREHFLELIEHEYRREEQQVGAPQLRAGEQRPRRVSVVWHERRRPTA